MNLSSDCLSKHGRIVRQPSHQNTVSPSQWKQELQCSSSDCWTFFFCICVWVLHPWLQGYQIRLEGSGLHPTSIEPLFSKAEPQSGNSTLIVALRIQLFQFFVASPSKVFHHQIFISFSSCFNNFLPVFRLVQGIPSEYLPPRISVPRSLV